MNSRRRPVRRTGQKKDSDLSLKPVIFLLVILFSLAMRFADTGPLYSARLKISEVLSRNIDIDDAVETLGRVFTGNGDKDESSVLVFGRMILGIDNDTQDAEEEADKAPTSSLIDPLTARNTMAADLHALKYEISESPAPALGAGAVISLSEDEDDDMTPDEPFEIPSPDTVDDTAYKTGFSLTMPLSSYRLTSPFGYRIHPISGNTTFHYGADLAAPSGTEVMAVAEGIVSLTSSGQINGNYIRIDHDGGFSSQYAHLKSIGVKEGEHVSLGQAIGTVGSTGYSTGPHLHFEMRKDGSIINPFDYFDFR